MTLFVQTTKSINLSFFGIWNICGCVMSADPAYRNPDNIATVNNEPFPGVLLVHSVSVYSGNIWSYS